MQAEGYLYSGRDALEHADVGAGAEEAVARAAQHQDVHRRVDARVEDGGVSWRIRS